MNRAAQACLAHLPARVWKQVAQGQTTLTLAVAIVGRARMARVNGEFRNKPRPTDVLSFPANAFPKTDLLGDLLICPAVARTQLKDFGTTYPRELERLVVHGVLHLFGYDHETGPADARRMFRLQEKILGNL